MSAQQNELQELSRKYQILQSGIFFKLFFIFYNIEIDQLQNQKQNYIAQASENKMVQDVFIIFIYFRN